jgi:hypothetical protein
MLAVAATVAWSRGLWHGVYRIPGSGETMKTHVERFVVIALGFTFACRQSAPQSNDVSSAASAGAAGQPGATVGARTEPAAAAPWPVTCDEAAARAIEKMGPNGVERLRSLTKDELIELHFSLGLNIRNGFGLWDGNQALLDSCANTAGATPEPDSVSMMIITRAWEIVHGERKSANGSK